MKTTRTNDSGMALIAVLAVISLLLIASLELARKTGVSAMASANTADRIISREKAITGLHLAMALLAEDGATSELDSAQENWADPDKLAQAAAAIGYDRANLVLEIQDELGKLPVNALIKKYPGRELNPDSFRVWERFLEAFTEEPVALLNGIQDWLDNRDDDAVTGISGAESDYYLSLDPPYTCANGPFIHISELFMVKGISPELFKVSQEEPRENENRENPVELSPPEDLITVHGIDKNKSGKGYYGFSATVNINTAPEQVISALLPRDKSDLAKDLVSYRVEQTENHDFINSLDKGWVDPILGLSKNEKARFNRLVRYDSNLFRVKSKAKEGTMETILSALILRVKDKLTGKWSCRILQMTKEE